MFGEVSGSKFHTISESHDCLRFSMHIPTRNFTSVLVALLAATGTSRTNVSVVGVLAPECPGHHYRHSECGVLRVSDATSHKKGKMARFCGNEEFVRCQTSHYFCGVHPRHRDAQLVVTVLCFPVT